MAPMAPMAHGTWFENRLKSGIYTLLHGNLPVFHGNVPCFIGKKTVQMSRVFHGKL
jgi:hypothetical protein